MDEFGTSQAMLDKTGNQHQTACNQRKIEQLENCSLNTLHIKRRDTHNHQADMTDTGVSQ